MNKRALFIGVGILAGILILCIGALAIAAASYFLIWDKNTFSAQAAPAFLQSNGVGENKGTLVSGVVAGSPAEDAGLVRGDIILEINGEMIEDDLDYWKIIDQFDTGKSLSLKVLHGDEIRQLNLVVEGVDRYPFFGIEICHNILDVAMFSHSQEIIGVVVTEITNDSPAKNAGLEVGDRIISVNDTEINADNLLSEIITQYQPGDKIILLVEREPDTSEEIEVTLGENPDNPEKAYLGIYYLPAQSSPVQDGEYYRIFPFGPIPEGFEPGLIISAVEPGSPAADSGLQRMDLILELNGEPIVSLDAFVNDIKSFSSNDEITLTIYRFGEQAEFDIKVSLTEKTNEPGTAYLGVRLIEMPELNIEQYEDGSKRDPLLPYFKLNPFREDFPKLPKDILPKFFDNWLPGEDL